MKHSEHNLCQYHFQSSVYCQMRIIKATYNAYTVRIHLELLSSAVSELPDERRLLPKPATVAEFGNSRRFWQQSPNWATIVASVDRP